MSEKSSYSGECSNSNKLPSFLKALARVLILFMRILIKALFLWLKAREIFHIKTGLSHSSTFQDFLKIKSKKHLSSSRAAFRNVTMSQKAYKNKKLGYRLWKEGFVGSVFVKPSFQGSIHMFFVKCRVHSL